MDIAGVIAIFESFKQLGQGRVPIIFLVIMLVVQWGTPFLGEDYEVWIVSDGLALGLCPSTVVLAYLYLLLFR